MRYPEAEYDGLRGGALAWVLGERGQADGVPHHILRLGHGVDRMQRLSCLNQVNRKIKAVQPIQCDHSFEQEQFFMWGEQLETKMQQGGLMDWTPDGMVLSKLESPSGDLDVSTELDARQGQLFNIAVQGPAITTEWTSDANDSKLQCLPMDKALVCIVGQYDEWSGVLQKFKLMRSTSAHMYNHSNSSDFLPTGEYILGGWCIGTVLDSAASRSCAASLVRTSPMSMALNLHVNIQWWSSKKLRDHFYNNGLMARGQKRRRDEPVMTRPTEAEPDADVRRLIEFGMDNKEVKAYANYFIAGARFAMESKRAAEAYLASLREKQQPLQKMLAEVNTMLEIKNDTGKKQMAALMKGGENRQQKLEAGLTAKDLRVDESTFKEVNSAFQSLNSLIERRESGWRGAHDKIMEAVENKIQDKAGREWAALWRELQNLVEGWTNVKALTEVAVETMTALPDTASTLERFDREMAARNSTFDRLAYETPPGHEILEAAKTLIGRCNETRSQLVELYEKQKKFTRGRAAPKNPKTSRAKAGAQEAAVPAGVPAGAEPAVPVPPAPPAQPAVPAQPEVPTQPTKPKKSRGKAAVPAEPAQPATAKPNNNGSKAVPKAGAA